MGTQASSIQEPQEQPQSSSLKNETKIQVTLPGGVLPYKLSGKFNGKFSIILLHGHGQNHNDWDDIDKEVFNPINMPDWNKGIQFKDKLKGKLNFQQKLAQITSTISYTRREQCRLNNIERKTDFPNYMPNETFANPIYMFNDMIQVLKVAKVPGPYLLIGFSSGGLLTLEFQRRMTSKNCIGCVLLDPQLWVHNAPGIRLMKDAYLQVNSMDEKKHSELMASDNAYDYDLCLSYYSYKNWLSNFKLLITVPTKCWFNIYEITPESKNDFTELFFSYARAAEELSKSQLVKIRVLFDELHAVHVLHDDEIFADLKSNQGSSLTPPFLFVN